MAQTNPFRNFRFLVDIGGITAAGFADATIPDMTVAPVNYREGDDQNFGHKLSGLTTYGNISLKRGMTDSTELYEWHQQVIDSGAEGARKSFSLILTNEVGDETARWNVIDAWPTKYDASDMSAKGNDVVIETLDLVCEEVLRV